MITGPDAWHPAAPHPPVRPANLLKPARSTRNTADSMREIADTAPAVFTGGALRSASLMTCIGRRSRYCVFDQPDDVVIERQGGAHTGHHDAWTSTRQGDSGSAQCAADLRSGQAELGDRAALVSQLGG